MAKLLYILPVLVLAVSLVPVVQAQDGSEIAGDINKAVEYMKVIANFARSCAGQMQFDTSIIEECMSVIQQLNVKMDELWSTHGDIIRKYTGGPLG
jgi:hypothetical protein